MAGAGMEGAKMAAEGAEGAEGAVGAEGSCWRPRRVPDGGGLRGSLLGAALLGSAESG